MAELDAIGRAGLGERWTSAFGSPVPKSMQEAMLRRMLAWHLQIQASPHWRQPIALKKLVRSLNSDSSTALTPGTQLLRQWKDKTHQVTVLSSGFEYDKVSYRSLSAIARQITGTSWSGPAFFGVRT